MSGVVLVLVSSLYLTATLKVKEGVLISEVILYQFLSDWDA